MLHSGHLEGYLSHAGKAARDTATLLTRDFREHAKSKGLPDDLVQNLHVWHNDDTGTFHATAMSQEHQDRLNDIEFGSPERAPKAVVSSFLATHADRAVDYMSAAMLHRASAGF
jgi:hypothetical protein